MGRTKIIRPPRSTEPRTPWRPAAWYPHGTILVDQRGNHWQRITRYDMHFEYAEWRLLRAAPADPKDEQ